MQNNIRSNIMQNLSDDKKIDKYSSHMERNSQQSERNSQQSERNSKRSERNVRQNFDKISSNNMRNEILELEQILKAKKEKLFLTRLFNMLDAKIYNMVSDIKIDIKITDEKNPKTTKWTISYKHHTKEYDPTDYIYENDKTVDNKNVDDKTVDNKNVDDKTVDNKNVDDKTVDETEQEILFRKTEKTTLISFGKSDKYFIRGGVKYNIYTNSKGELRIVNTDYDSELDIDEQKSLISKYANNKNIPESFALCILLYMAYNKWDDTSMAIHLSVV